MKTLLLPVYMPVAYSGATPQPYQSSIVDGFERKLVSISTFVMRQEAMRLLPSVDGRFVSQQLVKAYSFSGKMEDVLTLAIKTFSLKSASFLDDDGFAYSVILDELGEVECREIAL